MTHAANAAKRKALDRAARPSVDMIRRDRKAIEDRAHKGGFKKICVLLKAMERDLFDSSLNIEELKRRCEIRDNSISILFHTLLRRPPAAYLKDRRMDVACRLLTGTNLKVWEIAEMTGHSSLQVFSRAFYQWSGERPSKFREITESTPHISPEVKEYTTTDLLRLRNILTGAASKEDALAIIGEIANLYDIASFSRPWSEIPTET